MVISKFSKSRDVQSHVLNVKKLQREISAGIFDSTVHEINDSLTSILAVCETEGKEAIPKIKQYIHRINQSLENAKNTQESESAEEKFNITQLTKSVVSVVQNEFKNRKLICLVSDIKAPTSGSRKNLELLLLNLLTDMFSSGDSDLSEVLIELRQKDQDVMLTIIKDLYHLTPEIHSIIDDLIKKSTYEVNISPQGQGIEVVIKAPLQFGLSAVQPGIKVSDVKLQQGKQSVNKKEVNWKEKMSSRSIAHRFRLNFQRS